jgi:predicted DsbA family dithiol-disulfide isomerase
MPDRTPVDYWSDVLCVWAWIAQPRLEQALNDWADRVTIRLRFLDVFGNAHDKIRRQWGGDKGFERFADHVQDSARDHPHTRLHEGLWREVRPCSSLPAHLHVKAAECALGPAAALALSARLREAFFTGGEDISRRETLDAAVDALGLDAPALRTVLESGEALAALAADQREAQDGKVSGSPTWVLNDGRQLLYGNVGYRILNANFEELLRERPQGASWC